jgi:sec-independent protein translocase protein TatC
MRKLGAALRFITTPFRLIIRWFFQVASEFKSFFSKEIEDSPVADVVERTIEHPGVLLEHIDALRKHLLRAAVFLFITSAFSFIFVQKILQFLTWPLEGGLASLEAVDVTEPIGTVMRVILLSGFALAFPYTALELWLFIAPAISPRSRLYSLLAIPVATLLFIGGMAFAYFIMLPTALPFLLHFMNIATIPRPSSYFPFVTGLLFWIGAAFEFPLVIFLLATLGLVKAETLRQQWRLAIVIISIIAALVTPTVDPINMGLVMGPMIVLYFISILLAKIGQNRRHTE